MVTVEPFVYQKVTAFKERIQMVNKINELVDAVNEGIDPEEVRAIVTEMLADYYDKEEIDEMFDAIDFSPYYTKTEVDEIVDRIDDDIDGLDGRLDTAEDDIIALDGRMDDAETDIGNLEDRMDTAEGDIDSLEDRMDTAEGDIDDLETGKQDVLTAGAGIDITTNVVSLKGWTGHDGTTDATAFAENVSADNVKRIRFTKNVLVMCLSGPDNVAWTSTTFIPKGTEYAKHAPKFFLVGRTDGGAIYSPYLTIEVLGTDTQTHLPTISISSSDYWQDLGATSVRNNYTPVLRDAKYLRGEGNNSANGIYIFYKD